MAVVDIEKYKKSKGSSRKKKLSKFVFFTVLLSIFVFAFVFYTPFFKVHTIVSSNNFIVSNDEVDNLLSHNYEENIFLIGEEDIKQELLKNVYIKNIKMTKKYPDKLLVDIEERKPAGIIVSNDGFIKVSDDGVFLSINQKIEKYDLPIITGLDLYSVPGIGERFENNQLYEIIAIINEVNPVLLKEINEINLNFNGITAYTKNRLEIRLGDKKDISEKLEVLEEILNGIIGVKIDVDQVEYIDLSYKDSYIIKRKSNDMKGD